MAKRMSKKREPPGQRQISGAPPIIEDAGLPRMGEGESSRQGRPRAVMPDDPKPDRGKRNRMRPARKTTSRPTGPPSRGFRDQEKPRRSRLSKTSGAGGADAYLRLRVLIQDGELSLAGATVVEGPLTQSPALHPGLAYEVTLGSRRLAVGQVQDAGVWRSFPDPSGRPALAGHHITVLPSYEIAVRIPLTGLSMAALRRATITVYRWHGNVATTEGDRSIKARLRPQVETIGSLKGIRIDALPKDVHARLRSALQRR
jgi:hypothetical protein